MSAVPCLSMWRSLWQHGVIMNAAAAKVPPATVPKAAPLSADEFRCVLELVFWRMRCQHKMRELRGAMLVGAVTNAFCEPPEVYHVAHATTVEIPQDQRYCGFGTSWAHVTTDVLDRYTFQVEAWTHLEDPATRFDAATLERALGIVERRCHVQLRCSTCNANVNVAKWLNHLDRNDACRAAAPDHQRRGASTSKWCLAPCTPTELDKSVPVTASVLTGATWQPPVDDAWWCVIDECVAVRHTGGDALATYAFEGFVPFDPAQLAPVPLRVAVDWMMKVAYCVRQVCNRNQTVRPRFPALSALAGGYDLLFDVQRKIPIVAVAPMLLPRDEEAQLAIARRDATRLGEAISVVWQAAAEAVADLAPQSPEALVRSRIDVACAKAAKGALTVEEVYVRLLSAYELLLPDGPPPQVNIDFRAFWALREVVGTAVADAMLACAPDAQAPQQIAPDAPLPGFDTISSGWTFGSGRAMLRSCGEDVKCVELWASAMLEPLDSGDGAGASVERKIALLREALDVAHGFKPALQSLVALQGRPLRPDVFREWSPTTGGLADDGPGALLDDACAALASPAAVVLAWCGECGQFIPSFATRLHQRRRCVSISGVEPQLRHLLDDATTPLAQGAAALCAEHAATLSMSHDDPCVVRVVGQNAANVADELVKMLRKYRFIHPSHRAL